MIRAALHRASRALRRRIDRWNTASFESHGIHIWITTDTTWGTHAELFARVDAALALIAQHQPWRLRRVRLDIRHIWLYRQPSFRASYRHDARACVLDTYFVAKHPPEAVAASIVHEAVHGRLAKRSFERTTTWEERVCRRAEVSLGRALPNGAAVVARAQAVVDQGDAADYTIDWDEVARERRRTSVRESLLPEFMKRWLLARVR